MSQKVITTDISYHKRTVKRIPKTKLKDNYCEIKMNKIQKKWRNCKCSSKIMIKLE